MDELPASPPSPAPSPDFLDELDDEALEAYLASQGALSHWPTPPLESKSKGVRIEVEAISISSASTESDDEDVDGGLHLARRSQAVADRLKDIDLATLLAKECDDLYVTADCSREDILILEAILFRARLPTEILALSLNILSKLQLHQNTLPTDSTMSNLPVRLLVTSAICLASSCMDDHPPPPSWWNKKTCCCPQRTPHVLKVNNMILKALDWRLHDLASPAAIEVAMQRFVRLSEPAVPSAEDIFERDAQPIFERAIPLALALQTSDYGAATWRNGQLTPDETPTEDKAMFLPVLPQDGFLPDSRIQPPKTNFLPLL